MNNGKSNRCKLLAIKMFIQMMEWKLDISAQQPTQLEKKELKLLLPLSYSV